MRVETAEGVMSLTVLLIWIAKGVVFQHSRKDRPVRHHCIVLAHHCGVATSIDPAAVDLRIET